MLPFRLNPTSTSARAESCRPRSSRHPERRLGADHTVEPDLSCVAALARDRRGHLRGGRRRRRDRPHDPAPSGDPSPSGHRHSWTSRSPRVSSMPTTASSSSSSAAALPSSTATATGGRTCTWPEAPGPAALFRNETHPGGSLRFATTRRSGDRPGRGDRRLPDRHRWRPIHRPRRAAARRERPAAWDSATAASSARTNASAFDGGDAWTVGFSATWEAPDAALPTLAFGDYIGDREERRRHDHLRRQRAAPACAATRPTYAAPIAAAAELVHAVDAVQRLGPLGQAGPARLERSSLLPRRRGAAVAHRARASRRDYYGREDGWARLRIWGMGIASQDLTGDGYPEVFLTSQGDNKLQTLAEMVRPARPTRHRPASAGCSPTGRTPAATSLPSTAWHAAVRGRQRRRLDGPLRREGQRRRLRPDFAMRDPSNLLLGQPDGTFVEVGRGGGHRGLRPARGGRRSPTSISTACLTSSKSCDVTTSGSGSSESGGSASEPTTTRRARPLARRRPRPGRPEPRRDRGLGRGPRRRPAHRSSGR